MLMKFLFIDIPRGKKILVLFSFLEYYMSGYHADTPITIKAEAIHEADSRIH